MPTYIRGARIDWCWAERSDDERAIVRRHQAQLDSRDHGLESFAAGLAVASGELPAVDIAALVFDETRSRTLMLAHAGVVQRVFVKDVMAPLPAKDGPGFVCWSALRNPPTDVDGTIACGAAAAAVHAAFVAVADGHEPLPPDDDGGVEVPLDYTAEEPMRRALALAARAMAGAPFEFIAEVPSQSCRRFWVTLRPGRAEIRATRSWASSDSTEHAELIERLLAADPVALMPETPSLRERAGKTDKVEQSLYFPESMIDHIRAQSLRCDRSLSSVVQSAWRFAEPTIVALADRAAGRELMKPQPDSQKYKQSLYFPTAMLEAMAAQAARFDSSLSWVTQLACAIAAEHLTTLPSVD